MKNKFRLQLDLNSSKSKKNVKTPEILRKKDYSPMPVDSPHSIKHRISVIEVETEVSQEIEEKKQEYKEGKQKHK